MTLGLAAGDIQRPFRGQWRMPARLVKKAAAAGGFRLTCAAGFCKKVQGRNPPCESFMKRFFAFLAYLGTPLAGVACGGEQGAILLSNGQTNHSGNGKAGARD